MNTTISRSTSMLTPAPANQARTAGSSSSAVESSRSDGPAKVGQSSFEAAPARGVAAQAVVVSTPAAPEAGGNPYPLAEGFGETLGMGLGLIVTEALSAAKSWNEPVLDEKGQPVQSVPGAERVGDHDILKRHQEVVGPKVSAMVEKLPPGELQAFLKGLGKGATDAPGTAYRLEAAWSDLKDEIAQRL